MASRARKGHGGRLIGLRGLRGLNDLGEHSFPSRCGGRPPGRSPARSQQSMITESEPCQTYQSSTFRRTAFCSARQRCGTPKPNALPEPIRRSADPDLDEQERWLQSWLDRYESITGPGFRSRKDPIRVWLEIRLLARWIVYSDGDIRDLSFSRKLDGTPCGPLVEFLTLTLNAILGTAPGPDGIAKIIDQHRKGLTLPDRI